VEIGSQYNTPNRKNDPSFESCIDTSKPLEYGKSNLIYNDTKKPL